MTTNFLPDLVAFFAGIELPVPDAVIILLALALISLVSISGARAKKTAMDEVAKAYQAELVRANRNSQHASADLARARAELERQRQRNRRATTAPAPRRSMQSAPAERTEKVENGQKYDVGT
ncbi:MAG: hypothetical protein AAFV87_08455 [Pseudomonadota bacterium]